MRATNRIIPGTVGALALALGTAAAAQDQPPLGEVTANVGFFTDYIFRGVSQTDQEPAVQGGFDWSHEAGPYVGVWGSNVDFDDGDEAHIEIDYYGGYANSIDNFSYDVGVIYYSYPGADDDLDFDYFEVAASVGYDLGVVSASVGFNYSPDFFGGSDDAYFYYGTLAVPLPYGFGLDGHFGHQDIEDNVTFGLEDYNEWNIGLTYALWGFDLDIRYHDTDLGDSECADICDARAVFGITRTF